MTGWKYLWKVEKYQMSMSDFFIKKMWKSFTWNESQSSKIFDENILVHNTGTKFWFRKPPLQCKNCYTFEGSNFKVHIFWEGHKILKNLHLTFDCMYCSQKLGEDFAKFCGLLRIYEV